MNTLELKQLSNQVLNLVTKKIKNKIFYHVTICKDLDIYITRDFKVKTITPWETTVQTWNQLDSNFLVLLRVALTDRRHLRRISLLSQEQNNKLFKI